MSALFYTGLKAMVIQSAVVVAVLAVADFWLRRRMRASLRYALWILVLIKLCLPPSLVLPTSPVYWLRRSGPKAVRLIADGAGERGDNEIVPILAKTLPGIRPPSIPGAHSAPRLSLAVLTSPQALLGVWLSGMAVLYLLAASRFRALRRLMDEATLASPDLQIMADGCSGRLGLKWARIKVYLSDQISSPALVGLFTPRILIPRSLRSQLTDDEMRAVFLHELLHFRRGDLLVAHFQTLLQIVYWFDPFVWAANHYLRTIREEAVDEEVRAELGDQAEDYPSLLLKIARLSLSRPTLGLGLLGIVEPTRSLARRISQLLDRPIARNSRLGVSGIGWAVLVALVLLPMAGRSDDSPPADSPVVAKLNSETAITPLILLSQPPTQNEILRYLAQAQSLTADQAAELEATLKAQPEAISPRIKLLGYYNTRQFKSNDARAAHEKHLLWLIEHHPEIAGSGPPFSLLRPFDQAAYDEGKRLWLKQMQAHPQSLPSLRNAAAYFLIADREIAEGLLKTGERQEPSNPDWSKRLAELYRLNSSRREEGAANEPAQKALAEMELAQSKSQEDIFTNLGSLSKMAFRAGAYDKAEVYAAALLDRAADHEREWSYGNAVHDGNMILGRIAVRNGNLVQAEAYLLAAGKTCGSPQLNSSGPNMSLARDLLERGRPETVLLYFAECGKFWKMGGEKLAAWSKMAQNGELPQFEANLDY